MSKKSEAVIIRKRGGKLAEIRIIPQGKQGQTAFSTDNVIAGSMETRSLEKFNDLIEWLEKSGRLSDVEKMILAIFN